ncbi:vinexin-like isoform X2 [Stigmatopora nigra]
MQSQLVDEAGCPNGFPREPGGPSGRHIITSPDMTQEVVISPGLPTPPLSPFRALARLPSAEVKGSDVNGGGPTSPSFGTYYGPPHGGVTNGVQTSPTREERLIKFSGIGPVDETGMPIASRSSVNKPRDWYKSMFKQIHKKPDDFEQEDSERWSARCLQVSANNTDEESDKYFRLSPHGALPDWSQDVSELSDPGKQQPKPKSIFDFEPENDVPPVSIPQSYRPPQKQNEKFKSPSVEASLVSELSRFEAELDSDIRGLEKRLSQKQQRQGWGEDTKNKDPIIASKAGNTNYSNKSVPKKPIHHFVGPSSAIDRLSTANDTMERSTKKEEKKMKAARVKFNFQAQSPRELTLHKGDIVYIHKQVDNNWFEGEHHGRAGIFPTTYLEILSPSEKPTPIKPPSVQVLEYGEAVALYNFNADLPVELPFRKGEVISITRCVNDKWLEGKITGTNRSGIFPASYVQVNKMPRTKSSSDDYSPISLSPGPQSPGRPLHSPCLQSPMSPRSPASLSPKREHSPQHPSSPLTYGAAAHSSHSHLSKESGNRWPHNSSKPASPANHNTFSSASPSAWSATSAHSIGGATANTPRYNDSSQGAYTKPVANSFLPAQASNAAGSTVVQHKPYQAVYNYKPQNADELELREGDIVQVIEKCDDGWFVGSLSGP